MNFRKMCLHSSTCTICVLLIAISLASSVTANPKFIWKPNDTEVVVGEDVLIRWEYSVSDKNAKFASFSPVWNYYDKNGTMLELATEDQSLGWKWKISESTCPTRLRFPVQRIHRFKPENPKIATLNITNVTVEDSGKYECILELISGSESSSMNLLVKVAPTTVPPTTRPTNTTDNSGSTATPTPPTGTNSTTTPKPQKDGPNVGAICGGVFGGLACCGACAGGYHCYKKSKKSSDQNCGNSGVELKTKEGNDNQTPPSA